MTTLRLSPPVADPRTPKQCKTFEWTYLSLIGNDRFAWAIISKFKILSNISYVRDCFREAFTWYCNVPTLYSCVATYWFSPSSVATGLVQFLILLITGRTNWELTAWCACVHHPYVHVHVCTVINKVVCSCSLYSLVLTQICSTTQSGPPLST